MDFASQLKKRMKERGVTHEELAGVLICKRTIISRYVNGHATPDLKTFQKIAAYLDVSYDYLLGDTGVTQRDHIDIAQKTGLADEAIKLLETIKKQSEVELDENDADYIDRFIVRREFKHILTIINYLLKQDIVNDFTVPILNYIDMERSLQKKRDSDWETVKKRLKDEFGDDIVFRDEDAAVEVIKNVISSNPKVTPYEEFRWRLEIEDLETQSKFAIWRMVENHKGFMLRVADEIMEHIEELPFENM